MPETWRDGLGIWTAAPEPEIADSIEFTLGDVNDPIAIDSIEDIGEPNDQPAGWRDGFGEWATS